MHVMKTVFKAHQPGLRRIGNRLGGGAWLRRSSLVAWKRVAMDQSMARCAALDLAKPDQVTPFEVAISMFEFPERRVRGARMKDVAHCQIELVKGPICLWLICRVNEPL